MIDQEIPITVANRLVDVEANIDDPWNWFIKSATGTVTLRFENSDEVSRVQGKAGMQPEPFKNFKISSTVVETVVLSYGRRNEFFQEGGVVTTIPPVAGSGELAAAAEMGKNDDAPSLAAGTATTIDLLADPDFLLAGNKAVGFIISWPKSASAPARWLISTDAGALASAIMGVEILAGQTQSIDWDPTPGVTYFLQVFNGAAAGVRFPFFALQRPI